MLWFPVILIKKLFFSFIFILTWNNFEHFLFVVTLQFCCNYNWYLHYSDWALVIASDLFTFHSYRKRLVGICVSSFEKTIIFRTLRAMVKLLTRKPKKPIWTCSQVKRYTITQKSRIRNQAPCVTNTDI